jgi:hypothetical protein
MQETQKWGVGKMGEMGEMRGTKRIILNSKLQTPNS